MENSGENYNFKINPDEFEIKLNEEFYDPEPEIPLDQAHSLRMNINKNDAQTCAPIEQIQKEAQEEAGPNIKIEVTKSDMQATGEPLKVCCNVKKNNSMAVLGALAAVAGILLLYSNRRR